MTIQNLTYKIFEKFSTNSMNVSKRNGSVTLMWHARCVGHFGLWIWFSFDCKVKHPIESSILSFTLRVHFLVALQDIFLKYKKKKKKEKFQNYHIKFKLSRFQEDSCLTCVTFGLMFIRSNDCQPYGTQLNGLRTL